MSRIGFINKLIGSTIKYSFKKADNNYDHVRFGKNGSVPPTSLKDSLSTLLSVIKNKQFYYSYCLLGDDYSKMLYFNLLLFKILGGRHVKLPVNNEEYWKKYNSVDRDYIQGKGTHRIGNFNLNKYGVNKNSNGIVVNTHPLSFLNTYLVKQYVYNHEGKVIGAEAGDIVIEAGACWGDTSLFFSEIIGSKGKVYAFEFEKRNLKVLNENLELNPGLSGNIEVVENAVWNNSGEVFRFTEGGPGTTVTKNNNAEGFSVTSVSIDDFVKDNKLERVDFIKMDIEGAELNALKGAEETIKRFTPKLAISVYHKFRDYYQIPEYLSSLSERYGLKYRFYLDHFTIYSEETVLFAKAE